MPGRQRIRDGYDYETYVAQALKRRGFRSIEQTAKSGDYGVDLLGKYHGVRYAIQCKYYADPVGGFAVQEAVAGMGFYGCDRAMVVTNSCLTKAARELAELAVGGHVEADWLFRNITMPVIDEIEQLASA
ncbi:MAG: restriction endonuclease, partial [Oscillospiraceae bacterium]|nr:restriction endonuclease [Oscillospiraceae bacterium]